MAENRRQRRAKVGRPSSWVHSPTHSLQRIRASHRSSTYHQTGLCRRTRLNCRTRRPPRRRWHRLSRHCRLLCTRRRCRLRRCTPQPWRSLNRRAAPIRPRTYRSRRDRSRTGRRRYRRCRRERPVRSRHRRCSYRRRSCSRSPSRKHCHGLRHPSRYFRSPRSSRNSKSKRTRPRPRARHENLRGGHVDSYPPRPSNMITRGRRS